MLTGRASHGYDPDDPEGPGLKTWQDLLKAGRLVPAGAIVPGSAPAAPTASAPAGPDAGSHRP